MPNTPKNAASILTDFADNESGLITPQMLRDFVVSVLNTVDFPVSTFAKTLLDDTTAGAARTTLGLGSAALSASSDFAGSVHTHAQSDVTGLVSALAGKASSSHTHVIADVTNAGTAAALNVPASGNAASGEVVKGSDTRLSDSRTPTAHASSHGSGQSDEITIAESQVTNLTTDLAALLPLAGGTMSGTLDMGGGSITNTNSLDLGSGSISGGTGISMNAGLTEFYGDIDIHGYSFKMSGGDGTGGNVLYMDGGDIDDANVITTHTLTSDGLNTSSSICTFYADANFNGYDVNMKDGGGTSGGTLKMDGGTINMDGGSIITPSGSVITDGTNTSIDPANRQLSNAGGTVVLDWDASGRVEVNSLLCNGNMSVDGSLDMYGHGIDSTGDINLNSGKQVIFNGSGGSLTMNKNPIYAPVIDPESSAPSSPAEGQIYYNTSNTHFYGWNGSAWKQLDN